MNSVRCAVIFATALWLAACHSKGGGGAPPATPPQALPQTYAATVTAVEVLRAADQLPLAVDGLPSSGGSITVAR